MFSNLILWAQSLVSAYGLSGIFIISFFESFIFPVPTAFFVTSITTLGTDPFIATVIATVASVLGACVGYLLGLFLGHPVAERLFKKHLSSVESWFNRYGAWAVFLAAFTPIPFKVFTWSSGILELNFKKFLIAAFSGRFVQFFIAAYFGSLFGSQILCWFGSI
ncbi:MAG: DedA family protein [Candidatus Aenigmatarchaeota archaeon]|nr:MAG: DedA family protein [Candidatus Aenigmarchaeota archaeon]RLJ08780.1 MAG: DedA family protein [Candidatus Aenigmarchaeota archaeon]